MLRKTFITSAFALAASVVGAQEDVKETQVLFENVRVFDGVGTELSDATNVLVTGNMISAIGADVAADSDATIIAGDGRTLMPGLSDCHWHSHSIAVTNPELLFGDPFKNIIKVALESEHTLMQGITTVRDVGGNIFGVKALIDEGRLVGPRILPSGAYLTMTSGHGEMRLPNVLLRPEGRALIDQEILGHTAIADGVPAVLRRTRENLMRGATQIKAMAGGGVASFSDPLDGAQFSLEELNAIVEEAERWNTYVTVHTYTAKAVQHALEAGVRSIEHGQMIDEETAQMLAETDAWLCLQPFLDDEDRIPLDGEFNNRKYDQMLGGTDTAYKLARKYDVNVGFGTDMQQNPAMIDRWGAQLVKLTNWYTPVEALQMATSINQEFFKMAGERHPYQKGPLGVVQEGAYADLLLVEGNPLENIELVADPNSNFKIIMKDGVIYKNTLE
ncbi:amidohydrolase family protein [Ruegeria sp. WL0004]|uniref:Amidohydrolase family protein n=1 Tax=Ruegeria marisflavi TaxID=2984152 RepID=A0ABT2WWZ7_9RHOB|nr:amidohydrolase family protein [Ruegeria sp. WL0004]MCU9840421.1 amidohydrolase family protein [Ruegeria sp. WL0004]